MKLGFLLPFILPFARWGLSLLKKRFVGRLPESQTKTDLNVLFLRVEELVKLLTDSDPKDAEQLDALWKKVVGQDMSQSATLRIAHLASSVEDERLRKTILTLSRPGIDVLGLISDDDKNDVQQVADRFKEFAANPATHDLVLYEWLEPTLLANKVPAFVVGMLLESIADAIDRAFEGGATVKTLSAESSAVVRHLRVRSEKLSMVA